MTQKKFIIIALACNVLFLFIYIHKQSWLMQLTYAHQKNEHLLSDLKNQEKKLFNKLQASKNHTTIQKKAINALGMHKAQLKNLQQFEPNSHSRGGQA
jgi:hypothetical protein